MDEKERRRKAGITPNKARELYEHKLNKRWPFLQARGYDWEEITDYHSYGRTIRPDNLPTVRAYQRETDFFYLHSTKVLRGVQCYTFLHIRRDTGDVRGLMFTDFTSAYRYAYAHGCHIVRKPQTFEDITEYMRVKYADDADLFTMFDVVVGRQWDAKPNPLAWTSGGASKFTGGTGHNFGNR